MLIARGLQKLRRLTTGHRLFAVVCQLLVATIFAVPAKAEADGWIGVTIVGIPSDAGEICTIEGVVGGGPASVSGLRRGDVIVAIGDLKNPTTDEFRAKVASTLPGSIVPLMLRRANVEIPTNVVASSSPFTLLGARIESDIVPSGPLKLPKAILKVSGVSRDGPAYRAGLREGDSIAAVDGKPAANVDDVISVLMRAGAGGRVSLRTGASNELEITLSAFQTRLPPIQTGSDVKPRPVTVENFRNTDPGALPRGLYFDSKLPVAWRRMLLDDFAWLSKLGELPRGAALAAALGLETPLRGDQLLTWLLDRVVVIAGIKSSPEPVVLSAVLPGPARVASVAGDLTVAEEADVSAKVMGAKKIAYFTADARIASDKEINALRIDDRYLLLARSATKGASNYFPVVFVDEQVFASKDSILVDRITRLGILLHEASHLSGLPDHHLCSTNNLDRVLHRNGFWSDRMRETSPCDDVTGGAYAVEASVRASLVAACSQCTIADKYGLANEVISKYIESPLPSPVRIPAIRTSAHTRGLVGAVVSSLPPSSYFEESLALIDLSEAMANSQGRTCPQCDVERGTLIDLRRWAKDQQPNIACQTRECAVPKGTMPLDTDVIATRKWLSAALQATSHNVPLMWVPRCEQFLGGCR